MPSEAVIEAGVRFARDLRTIRELRKVTLDDVHQKTRITPTLITAFESDGLFDHPTFNRVYLRSFVRAYAGCISVEPDRVLHHLDRALEGEYRNELAVQITGAEPEVVESLDRGEGEADPDATSDDASPVDGQTGRTAPAFDDRTDEPGGQEEIRGPNQGSSTSGSSPGTSTTDEEQTPSATKDSPPQSLPASSGHASGDDIESTRETASQEAPAASEAAPETAPEGTPTEERRPHPHSFYPRPVKETSQEEKESKREESKPEESATDTPVREETTGQWEGEAREDDSAHDAPRTPDAFEETADDPTRKPDPARFSETKLSNTAPSDKEPSGQDLPVTETESTRSKPDRRSTPSERSEESESPDKFSTPQDEAASEAAPASPAARFRMEREDPEGPPPPQSGEMVGRPRPIGEAPEPESRSVDAEKPHLEASPEPRPTGSQGSPTARPVYGKEPNPSKLKNQDAGVPASSGGAASVQDLLASSQREIMIGGGLIGLVLVILIAWMAVSGGDAKPESTPTAQTVDTVRAEAEGATSTPSGPPASLELGRSIHVAIRANEPVQGIRIQRDSDLRRPYWIDEGEVSVFPFSERIVIEQEPTNVDLFVEGYAYPTDGVDIRGRVIITRDSVQAFSETLRGEPVEFSTPPDTISIPPPSLQ